jgi:hypothetical protein
VLVLFLAGAPARADDFRAPIPPGFEVVRNEVELGRLADAVPEEIARTFKDANVVAVKIENRVITALVRVAVYEGEGRPRGAIAELKKIAFGSVLNEGLFSVRGVDCGTVTFGRLEAGEDLRLELIAVPLGGGRTAVFGLGARVDRFAREKPEFERTVAGFELVRSPDEESRERLLNGLGLALLGGAAAWLFRRVRAKRRMRRRAVED